jgi:hypothetical protein
MERGFGRFGDPARLGDEATQKGLAVYRKKVRLGGKLEMEEWQRGSGGIECSTQFRGIGKVGVGFMRDQMQRGHQRRIGKVGLGRNVLQDCRIPHTCL